MNKDDDFLTKIREDYPHSHLLHIQLIIRYAYRAVLDLTTGKNANPIFDTPQKDWFSGLLRYIAVDSFLQRACGEMKLLKGITTSWSPLGGSASGVWVLELKGKHTSLIAHHLNFPDDPPRSSNLRDEWRLWNQQHPLITNFPGAEESRNLPFNVFLVHGGKAAEFAYLRVYHDGDSANAFTPVYSENIMALSPVSQETEQISDAEVKLKEHLKRFKREHGQE